MVKRTKGSATHFDKVGPTCVSLTGGGGVKSYQSVCFTIRKCQCVGLRTYDAFDLLLPLLIDDLPWVAIVIKVIREARHRSVRVLKALYATKERARGQRVREYEE